MEDVDPTALDFPRLRSPEPNANARVHEVAALPVARFRLSWTAMQEVDGRQYLGSAWRGVFGHALRKLVCVTRMPQCAGCMLLQSCAYPYLFETPGSGDAMNREGKNGPTAAAAPHPLILRMETVRCPARAAYTFSVVLLGDAVRFLGYAVRAFQEAGERGVSAREYRFQLRQVLQEVPVGSGEWRPILNADRRLAPAAAATIPIPPCPATVRIRLLSPMRLRKEGSYVSGDDSLGEILAAIVRRVLLLRSTHGQGALEQDLGEWFARVRAVRATEASLRWQDWERYSNRQQSRMLMGGLRGEIVFDTASIADLWPLLWVGQFVHAGKATSMGLGAYTLEVA